MMSHRARSMVGRVATLFTISSIARIATSTPCASCKVIATAMSISSSSSARSDQQSGLQGRDILARFDRMLSSDQGSEDVLLLDGGTGEELFRLGVPDDRRIWSATALVHSEHHETLKRVHQSFINAGSNAITTNSYGVVPGVGFSTADMVKYVTIAGQIARDAVDEARQTGLKSSQLPPLVFGSLGPLVESYRADLIMDHDEGVPIYSQIAQALLPYVDVFLAETMSCVDESIQVVDALTLLSSDNEDRDDQTAYANKKNAEDNGRKEPSKPVMLMISYTLDSNGCFRNGQDVPEGIGQLLDFLSKRPKGAQIRLLGILFNCSEPEAITLALKRLAEKKNDVIRHRLREHGIVLGAYANRLTPVDPNWTLAESEAPQPMRNDLNEQEYWESCIKPWIEQLKVKIVGGCCGITPEHIAYISSKLNDRG